MIAPLIGILILINPGVVFATEVGVQYRFETPQHFLRVQVGDTHLKLDVVDMLYSFNNGTMNANLSKVTQLDLRWNGSVPTKGISYFNASGLKTSASFRFLEDGKQKLTKTSDSNGFVSFRWVNWTSVHKHSFEIVTTGDIISGGIRSTWILFLLITVGGTIAVLVFVRKKREV